MSTTLVTIVAGARPNFMKIAPIIAEIEKVKSEGAAIDFRLVHTGQHYDGKMSDNFFEQLGIPEPHINLGARGATQAEQTAAIMVSFEKDLMENRPSLVLVVGDVTSTMACAIAAQKLCIPVAHVEAGIRSGDWAMPEEINRIVTDSITNYFFTTTELAGNMLKKTGVEQERIFFVGNTMIDTLLRQMPHFRKPPFWDEYHLAPQQYLVLTLHRPSNVDDEAQLRSLFEVIERASQSMPVIFPAHPRTTKNMERFGIQLNNVKLVEPMGYLEFNYLVQHAKAVITDSGGVTEETTVMNVPCMTIRENTERPETCTMGTNELLGTKPESLEAAMNKVMEGNWKKGSVPPLWDGHTAERIVAAILSLNLGSLGE